MVEDVEHPSTNTREKSLMLRIMSLKRTNHQPNHISHNDKSDSCNNHSSIGNKPQWSTNTH